MTQNFFIDVAEENIMNVIRFFRGDNHTLNFYVKDDGEIFDLTNYSAVLSVKENESDTTYQFQLYGAEVSYDISKGLITFLIEPTDTESMDSGEYVYDVEISNGTNTYTIVSDVLDLKGDITTDTIPSYLITENSQKLIFE